MKRNNVVRIMIGCLLCLSAPSVWSQQTAEDLQMQQAQFRKVDLDRRLDSAIYYMDIGKYLIADHHLKFVLNNSERVSSNVTFFFGKNSYYLGNYAQALDWLDKYIQLKGTAGQYYGEATELRKKAEESHLHQTRIDMESAKEVLSSDYEIDCGPTGNVICPVCHGEHVVIKPGPFGNTYKTCQFCSPQGILTCEQYNQLIRGELKPNH